jgi:hypothetical protein
LSVPVPFAAAATTFTCRGDSAFEIADGCGHFGVDGACHATAIDLRPCATRGSGR